MPLSDVPLVADPDPNQWPRVSPRNLILAVLLMLWIGAILVTEPRPARLEPPLVPYGTATARPAASSASISPPPIRGR